MNVTRRSILQSGVLQSAGLLVAGPAVLSPSLSASVIAQSTPKRTKTKHFSKDLHSYHTETMALIVSKAQSGAVTDADLRRAASVNKLYARHIRSLHVEKVLIAAAGKVSPQPLSALPQSVFDHVLTSYQKHNPGYKAEDLTKVVNDFPTPTNDELATVLPHGFSYAFDQVADLFSAIVSLKKISAQESGHPAAFYPASPAHRNGNDSLYDSRSLHLENVNFGSCVKKACANVSSVQAKVAAATTLAAKTGLQKMLNQAANIAELAVEANASAVYGATSTEYVAASEAYTAAVAAAPEGVAAVAGVIEAACDVALLGPEAVVGAIVAGGTILATLVAACAFVGSA